MIGKAHNIFILIFLSGFQIAFSQGVIILEKQTPATAVTVVATQQVILKPGFHAVGTAGSFDGKIGPVNNVYPLIPMAQGSTAVIPTDPSFDQNYIRTSTYLTADATPAVMNTIQYFDGLGRSTQTVAQNITPTGADLVSKVEYDEAGREWKKYLPASVAGNFGQFTPESNLSSSRSSTYNSDSRAYVETLIEPSPLDRVSGEKGVGADWDSHPKTIDYLTSDGSIANFYVNSSNQLCRGVNYDAATLFVTLTTDEDNKTVTEYKDKQGEIIMKRSSNVDTYYVYNDLGELSYVIPPVAVDNMTAQRVYLDSEDVLKQFCYLYQYNERGNCTYKRLPGCEPIYMVYDKADRLILSQDGNQRGKKQQDKKQWTVTKYDAFGRVIMTGITYIDSTKTYISLGNDYSSQLITETYSSGTYSNQYFTTAIPLTVNYYDNYGFISTLSSDKQQYLHYDSNSGYDKAYPETAASENDLNAKGLLIGTLTLILDGTDTNYLASVMYYDDKGRVVQSRETNHLKGYNIVCNQYNFTGKVTRTFKKHKIEVSPEVTELYTYSYDNAQRPLVTNNYLNGATIPVVLASNSYDELGRLTTKLRHNTKDTEQHDYNIRNWPTRITSGSFTENLYYNSNVPTGTTPCYNGNIAYGSWTYKGATNKYGYNYDELNRLSTATTYDGNNQPSGINYESYTYDKLGNIKTLWRNGSNGSPMDGLTLTYNGNQLKKVDDMFGSQNQYYVKEYNNKANQTIEFKYDANGNMIEDLDRDIYTIQYNVLNLPDVIQFRNGNQIKNTYDAGGHKLGTEYFTRITNIPTPINPGDICNWTYSASQVNQSGTAYIGNFEYNTSQGNATLTTLSRIYNEEGYVENLSNPNYFYYRRDHLGDNREVWLANTNTTVQWTQYYPSGLPWASSLSDNPGLQHRKYNGKEFIEMHGYDAYDIVWRQYYPAIMRFQTPDPQIEDAYNLSPYTMCSDNMVNRIDPDGRWDSDTFSKIMSTGLKTAGVIVLVGGGPEEPAGDAVAAVAYVGFLATAAFIAATTPQRVAAFKSLNSSTKTSYDSNTPEANTANNNQAKANPNDNKAQATSTNYSNVPDPKNAGDGKKTTRSQRQKLLDENKKQNNGELKSDGDGRKLDPPSKNIKGQKANMNQAEVDHIKPKSKGGSNRNTNLRVISKEENLAKSNK